MVFESESSTPPPPYFKLLKRRDNNYDNDENGVKQVRLMLMISTIWATTAGPLSHSRFPPFCPLLSPGARPFEMSQSLDVRTTFQRL